MALQTAYKTKHGITLEAAYINISNVQTSKYKIQIEGESEKTMFSGLAFASVYASRAAYDEGAQIVETFEHTFVIDNSKPTISQAYEQIKSKLESESGATIRNV